MSVNVRFENNLPRFQEELKEKKKLITYAWGLKLMSLASQIITRNGQVVTGRLRGSISFITVDKSGSNGGSGSDILTGSSGDDGTVIVGTNVKYGRKVELTSRKGQFLKPACTDYKNSLEEIAKSILNSD